MSYENIKPPRAKWQMIRICNKQKNFTLHSYKICFLVLDHGVAPYFSYFKSSGYCHLQSSRPSLVSGTLFWEEEEEGLERSASVLILDLMEEEKPQSL